MGRGGDTTGGKLTANQEKFTQEMIKGKSQREAYHIAYPNSKKWKEESVDSKASTLFANVKVQKRYRQLIEKHQEKALMTRGELLEGLRKAFYMALGIEATPMITKWFAEGNFEVIEHKNIHFKLNFK